MPIKDFDDILNDKDYLPNSKLTAAQINEGWIEIESEGQLILAEEGHFDALAKTGEITPLVRYAGYNNWHSVSKSLGPSEMVENFIAYRPVPSYEEYQTLSAKYRALVEIYNDLQRQNSALVDQLSRGQNGKTLRDEIAIAAMPAISIHSSPATIEKTARRAYDLADAMIEARKKGDTNAE